MENYIVDTNSAKVFIEEKLEYLNGLRIAAAEVPNYESMIDSAKNTFNMLDSICVKGENNYTVFDFYSQISSFSGAITFSNNGNKRLVGGSIERYIGLPVKSAFSLESIMEFISFTKLVLEADIDDMPPITEVYSNSLDSLKDEAARIAYDPSTFLNDEIPDGYIVPFEGSVSNDPSFYQENFKKLDIYKIPNSVGCYEQIRTIITKVKEIAASLEIKKTAIRNVDGGTYVLKSTDFDNFSLLLGSLVMLNYTISEAQRLTNNSGGGAI